MQYTQNEIISLAKFAHVGENLDFSKVEFVDMQTKICIIDHDQNAKGEEYGEYWIEPALLIQGRGYPEKKHNLKGQKNVENYKQRLLQKRLDEKMGNKEKLQQFLIKAQDIHKDKYDYSKAKYVNADTKICIICPQHGEFWQTPACHLSGQGCPKCGIESKRAKLSDSKEEFIRKAREVHGDKYDYSEVEYVNNNTPVKIKCPIHGVFLQVPSVHLRGHGCSACSGRERNTQETFIKKAQELYGAQYDYSKVQYVNTTTKVEIICKKHNASFFQEPKLHLKGHGCPKCGVEARQAKKSLGKDGFIQKANEIHHNKYGYDSVVYTSNKQKVKIYCPIHKEYFEQTPHAHLAGQGCPKCASEENGKNKRLTQEYFIEQSNKIHNNKYDYSLVEYCNHGTPVKIICPQHGVFEQHPHNHLIGHGCPICSNNVPLDTTTFIKKSKQVHGDTYDYSLVEYVNNHTKVKIICPKHGVFEQVPNSHLQGIGCPTCGNKLSKAENEIADFIKSLGIEVEIRNRSILGGREIDIYLPNEKIGIEYNGIYWHSEEYNKDKNYHINKTNDCEKLGIRLIQIFEDEWLDHKDIVLSRIATILHKQTTEPIYARNCVLKEVNTETSKAFLIQNHIQGNYNAKYNIGLFYNDELVSLMTFGYLRYQDYKNDDFHNHYELLRFCNKLNTIIVGGASKLLHYFIETYQPKSITTYADRRWSDGQLYFKLGFTHTHNSEPNYFYIVNNRRENRFKYRKSELIKQGFDANKSERQIMAERGIYRIYDCGTMVFKMEFDKNNNKK